jgi:predicted small metal-binding protein
LKRFRCGDVVPGCSATFVGGEDEILTGVGDHAARDHGLVEVPAELVAAVRGAMVDA